MINLQKGTFFISEVPISRAVDIVSNEKSICETYPQIKIIQNIGSLEGVAVVVGEKIQAKFSVRNGKKLEEVDQLHFRNQDYLVTNDLILPICERSIAALNQMCQIEDFAAKDLSIKSFVELEAIMNRLGLSFKRDESLRKFMGMGPLNRKYFEYKLKLNPWNYQEIGIEWVLAKKNLGSSGVLLADFMSLGKTLQSIGVIENLARTGEGNRLVVVPNHLILNWIRELGKFAPNLLALIHKGPSRYGLARLLEGYDLVITTYPTLIRDISMLTQLKWEIVIADEAQAIKNSKSQTSKAIKSLDRNFSMAVTGTPLENNLREFWSVIDFVEPGLLGSWRDFDLRIQSNSFEPVRLHEETTHLKLRRDLNDVNSQLPPILIVPHVLEWPEELDDLYEQTRLDAISEFPRAGGFVATSRLRQLTTHPSLIGIKESDPCLLSPKFKLLVDIIEEVFANGDRALIFTSYNEMNRLIVNYFRDRFPNYLVDSLYGETSPQAREDLVAQMNSSRDPGILVCNVLVAGTGLNITGANHVIHYNLEWNPAKEDQATYRVRRPGQEKNVFVHRLLYANTIDEAIDERIQMKRQLADWVVEGTLERDDYFAGLEASPVKNRIRS